MTRARACGWALGEAAAARVTGPVRRRRRPRRRAARSVGPGALAAASSRAWTVGEARGVLAEPGDVGEADRGVDVVGLAAAAAAELHHDEAERADVDRRRRPRPPGRPRGAPAPRRGARRARSSRSAGPPSAATMRAKRSAAAPDVPARSSAVGVEPAELERGARQLERHLDAAAARRRRRAARRSPRAPRARCRPCGRAPGPCR